MKKTIILFGLLFITLQMAVAQCKVENKYFQPGEVLTYDMYVKFGVSTRAGALRLSVEHGKIKGKGDYKMTFMTNTTGFANSIFPIHDTLYSYTTKDIVPLAYVKKAMENKDYTFEELFYTYKNNGKIDIQTKRSKNGEFRFDEKLESDACIYDMVSVVYYARSLDYNNMKQGDKTSINFISGQRISAVDLEHRGFKKIKGNDGKQYECIELTLNFLAGGGSAEAKEMMKVYITNDKNRIPIQINSNLKKAGSIRGVIKSYKGLKN